MQGQGRSLSFYFSFFLSLDISNLIFFLFKYLFFNDGITAEIDNDLTMTEIIKYIYIYTHVTLEAWRLE